MVRLRNVVALMYFCCQKYQKPFAKKGVAAVFCVAKQVRHRALLADVA